MRPVSWSPPEPPWWRLGPLYEDNLVPELPAALLQPLLQPQLVLGAGVREVGLLDDEDVHDGVEVVQPGLQQPELVVEGQGGDDPPGPGPDGEGGQVGAEAADGRGLQQPRHGAAAAGVARQAHALHRSEVNNKVPNIVY